MISWLPCLLWQVLLYWPWFYYLLFWPGAKGRSIWAIIIDPKDEASWSLKMKNCKPPSQIFPLWSRFLVFSTYQAHGAYAHLYQAHHKDLAEATAGPPLPRVWAPLRLAIPYTVLLRWLFKPPDCYLACLATLALAIGVYTMPLTCAAMYLPYLCL